MRHQKATRVGSYFRFINAAVGREGMSRTESAQLYRDMKEKLKYSPTRADLKNHPRISTALAKRIIGKRAPIPSRARPIPAEQLPPSTREEEEEEDYFEYEGSEEGGEYEEV